MSRSRKKTAGWVDYSRSGTKKEKRFSNKAVRNFKGDISDGGMFKKMYCSWNIHDWAFLYFSENEVEYYMVPKITRCIPEQRKYKYYMK